MAKKSKISKIQENKTSQVKPEEEKSGMLVTIELFLTKYLRIFFFIGMGFSVLFSVLIFDLKVSVGGDDSAYIERAYDLIKDFKYPSFQGPLYPILLSPIMYFFGINLTALKMLSLVFIVLGMFLLFKVFQNRIPSLVLVPGFLITSICTTFLYYGSQTYSEALYFFLQALLFYVVFKFFTENRDDFNLKRDFKRILFLAVVMFLNVITKNIAYAGIIAVSLYFLISKQYKTLIFSISSFVGLNAFWFGIKKLLWSNNELQVSSQGAKLLQKHPYDPTQGQEDIPGYIQRFWDNTQIYLSKRVFEFTGWRPEEIQPQELSSLSPFLGILMLITILLAAIYVYKNNKYLFFTVLYSVVMYGITFIVLQKMWDSGRLIITYFPFTLISVLALLYYMSKSKYIMSSIGGLLYLVSGVILFIMHKYKKAEEINLIKLKEETGTEFKVLIEKLNEYSSDLLSIFFFVAVPILVIIFIVIRNKMNKSNVQIQNSFINISNNIIGIVLILVIVSTFITTFRLAGNHISENSKIRSRNMKGDMLAGFTPDWRNYIIMTQYAAKLLPDTINIACRKPNIAFIYSSRKFKGIYKVPSDDADTLLQELKKMDVDYIIVANLRKYEKQKTEYTINTINRFMFPIQKKYPNIFNLIHEVGTDEKASLIKINYSVVKDSIN